MARAPHEPGGDGRRKPAATGYEAAGGVGLVPLLKQGWDEFLRFPTVIVGAFIALAALTLWMDSTSLDWVRRGREVISRFVFVREQGTASVLGQLLGGVLTVISITFSVLLLAVQQTATSLSNQVYSQFLRRRLNQLYFGFFLGLAVYDLVALASAHPDFNPIYTASVAVAMSSLGLCLLAVLIYSTVDQMRPTVIVESVRDHTLGAREALQPLLAATRRACLSREPVQATIFADRDGFLQRVDLDRLRAVLQELRGADSEIEVLHTIGSFVGYDDALAVVRTADRDGACRAAERVKAALVLRGERDLRRDAAFGIVQLEAIGWTTGSSAKSTTEPPRLAINALRDLLGRWIATYGTQVEGAHAGSGSVAVVYPDRIEEDVVDAIVTIGIASGESMQPLVMNAAMDALGQLLPRAHGALRDCILHGIRTLVPVLGDVAMTARLENVLERVREALEREGAHDVAAELSAALVQKRSEKGKLRRSRPAPD